MSNTATAANWGSTGAPRANQVGRVVQRRQRRAQASPPASTASSMRRGEALAAVHHAVAHRADAVVSPLASSTSSTAPNYGMASLFFTGQDSVAVFRHPGAQA